MDSNPKSVGSMGRFDRSSIYGDIYRGEYMKAQVNAKHNARVNTPLHQSHQYFCTECVGGLVSKLMVETFNKAKMKPLCNACFNHKCPEHLITE